MASFEPPLEWIPGRSSAPWLLGLCTLLCGTLLSAALALGAALGGGPFAPGPPLITLGVCVLALALSAIPAFLWVLVIPYPAPRLGVSPGVVVIDFGLSTAKIPRGRLFVQGARLYTVSRASGYATTYSLTARQAARLQQLLPCPG